MDASVKARLIKWAPWIIGGGVVIGLYLNATADDESGGDSGSGGYAGGPYDPAYINAAAGAALAQSQGAAAISVAAGQVQAMNTQAQASLTAARATEAEAIGSQYAAILDVVGRPQLLAIQAQYEAQSDTIDAAAKTVQASLYGASGVVASFASSIGAQAGFVANTRGVGAGNGSTAAQNAGAAGSLISSIAGFF